MRGHDNHQEHHHTGEFGRWDIIIAWLPEYASMFMMWAMSISACIFRRMGADGLTIPEALSNTIH